MSSSMLRELQQPASLTEKFRAIHAALKDRVPFIALASAAVYDPETDTLTTLVQSGADEHPVTHYHARLATEPSLLEIVRSRTPRVIQDLDSAASYGGEPHQRLKAAVIRSSYTMPMFADGEFLGFLFFNSRMLAPFSGAAISELNFCSHLFTQVIAHELRRMRVLRGTVKTLREIARLRDDETAAHLDRMSRYSQLIARKVARVYGLLDEQVESIFLLSPLHDIGKIGVPDHILLKRGPLTEEERQEMKKHTTLGREVVDLLISNLGLSHLPGLDILRNISELHHEAVDGSGYPYGLRGDRIPVEARIVSVADVFDALTSRRPYKRAWSNEEAFSTLEEMSGTKLEPSFVSALVESRREVEAIQRHFGDDEQPPQPQRAASAHR